MQIAVGGCLAQKDKSVILEKAPWVDVVFGTHNMGALPGLLERARHNDAGRDRDPRGARDVPLDAADEARLHLQRLGVHLRRLQQHLHLLHRPVAARQGEGPPAGRRARRDPGPRRRRRHRGHAARPERQLLRRGVRRPPGVRQAAARGRIDRRPRPRPLHQPAPGRLHRRRDRRDGRDARRHAAAAHAAAVRLRPDPEGDAPLVPRRTASCGILDRVRERIPDAAITTDIIVGFPGETEEDFQETLRVVEAARFASAFTFQYSIRPGTPAATMADQVPKEVVQERYERLARPAGADLLRRNRALVGREVEVLVGTGEGRKDAATHRLTGRAPTTASCTSGCPRAPRSRARATSSPSGSPRPRPRS